MNTNDDQTTRWLAYFLGDLDPDDAARVEAEMREDPAKAKEVRRFFEATTDWAKRPVPESPIDLAELAARTRDTADVRAGRARFRKAWPWAAVAAAVVLVAALSQASFSMEIGGATLAWGTPPPTEAVIQLEREISTLNQSYAELAADNLRLYDGFDNFVFSLQQLQTQLRVATAELARNQEREAHTRYTDMERLLALTRRANVSLPYGNGPDTVQAAYTAKP